MFNASEQERRYKLLKQASKWVLDVTHGDIAVKSKGNIPVYNTYVHYMPDDNRIDMGKKTICMTCPGILMGVISKKGKKHLDLWLKNNPDWMDEYSAPHKIRPDIF